MKVTRLFFAEGTSCGCFERKPRGALLFRGGQGSDSQKKRHPQMGIELGSTENHRHCEEWGPDYETAWNWLWRTIERLLSKDTESSSAAPLCFWTSKGQTPRHTPAPTCHSPFSERRLCVSRAFPPETPQKVGFQHPPTGTEHFSGNPTGTAGSPVWDSPPWDPGGAEEAEGAGAAAEPVPRTAPLPPDLFSSSPPFCLSEKRRGVFFFFFVCVFCWGLLGFVGFARWFLLCLVSFVLLGGFWFGRWEVWVLLVLFVRC